MTWAYYLLQVNIYLVIFYIFYKLLLDRETYFMLNRVYLIAAGILSLIIPFLKPEWFVKQAETAQIRINIGQLSMMMANVTVDDQAAQFNWGHLVAGIYICGVVFFMCRFVVRLFAVQKLLKTEPAGMAFSFFRKKVIDVTLPGADTIDRHEDIHIQQLHTLDVLFYELMAILVWCNPVIYLYKMTVKNIHEYLADEQAAAYQGDKESYALLLLSRAMGIDENVLTNTFYHKSLLKNRIFMLSKQRSRKTAILKYGLFLPLFAVTLLFSSATIRKNDEIKAMAEKIASPTALADLVSETTISLSSSNQTDSWNAFYKFVSSSIKYPVAAHEKNLQGNTVIKFTVNHGAVDGLSVVTPLGLGCDAQVMKTILSFNDFKHIADGKYSLKVAFRIPAAKSPVNNATVRFPEGYTALKEVHVSSSPVLRVATNKGGKVYDFVSITTQPGFPGGMDKFYEYLAKNCKYPAQARDNNIQGKVFLSFIVETDGHLSDVKVERGLGHGTDEEALRLLKHSPKWTPGYDGATPVRVKYNIPISFTLADVPKKTTNIINPGSPSSFSTGEAPGTDEQKAYAISHSSKPIETNISIRDQHTIASIDKQVLKIGNNITYTPNPATKTKPPMFILDGKITDQATLNAISPQLIESMNISQGESATNKYGSDAKNGVVEIITKKVKTLDAIQGKATFNN